MPPDDEIARLADDVTSLIEDTRLRFERGEPRRYFSLVTKVNLGWTLPIVAPSDILRSTSVKNLCVLWNIIVDDEIDRSGTRKNLDDSLLLLLSRTTNVALPASTSPAEAVLRRLFALIPSVDARRVEAFHQSLWELMNGFAYEHAINAQPRLATSSEYSRYSTMTASIKSHLDIDWMFAATPPPATVYRRLRTAYDHLSLALKYSSDIGTLRRELREEQNLNLVTLAAAEAGLIELDGTSKIDENQLGTKEVGEIMNDVAQLAATNLASARSIVAGLARLTLGAS
jgi:hypothetical protein